MNITKKQKNISNIAMQIYYGILNSKMFTNHDNELKNKMFTNVEITIDKNKKNIKNNKNNK